MKKILKFLYRLNVISGYGSLNKDIAIGFYKNRIIHVYIYNYMFTIGKL